MYLDSNTKWGGKRPSWPFRANRGSWQTKDLVGWWPMSPVTGLGLRDMSGNGNHGSLDTNTGSMDPAASWVINGEWGPVLNFNESGGSTDHVNIGAHDTFDFGSEDFSISFWFDAPATQTTNGVLMGNGEWEVSAWYVQISGSDSTKLQLPTLVSGGSDITTTSTGFLTNDSFQQVSFVRLGTGPGKFYRNGVEEDSYTTQDDLADFTDADRDFNLMAYTNAGATAAKGSIFDVRIYKRALNTAEIEKLYNPATRWSAYEPVQSRYNELPNNIGVKVLANNFGTGSKNRKPTQPTGSRAEFASLRGVFETPEVFTERKRPR